MILVGVPDSPYVRRRRASSSSLILDHIESAAPPAQRLMPADVMQRREALRLIGLAMAACGKGVQMVHEKEQRPADKRHMPWMDRVIGQANAAYGELERATAAHSQRAEAWPEFVSTPLD